VTDQIHEARSIAHTLLRAFPDGPPACWSESAQAVIANALRLAELSAELLPMLERAVAEGVAATIDAHEQINGMQTNLERLGEGAN
jgi:hypothetical protein